MQLTQVNGPLARRVADLRGALEIIAGPTWRDPWTVPAPLRGPEPAKPTRVAIVLDPAGLGSAKQVQDGVRKAAHALDQAGYVVDEVEPPSIEAAAKALVVMYATPGHPRDLAAGDAAIVACPDPTFYVGVLRGGRRPRCGGC